MQTDAAEGESGSSGGQPRDVERAVGPGGDAPDQRAPRTPSGMGRTARPCSCSGSTDEGWDRDEMEASVALREGQAQTRASRAPAGR